MFRVAVVIVRGVGQGVGGRRKTSCLVVSGSAGLAGTGLRGSGVGDAGELA